jgi:excisionase family DNA binding protein
MNQPQPPHGTAEAADERSAEMKAPGPLWTVTDARAFLRCSPRQLYRLLAAGMIPHRRFGKRFLFDPDELQAWWSQLPGASLEQVIKAAGHSLYHPGPDLRLPAGAGASRPQEEQRRSRATQDDMADFDRRIKAIVRGDDLPQTVAKLQARQARRRSSQREAL